MIYLNANAQNLTWKNYSSMYDINAITTAGGNVWAASSGGVFSYSPVTGSFKEFTTTEGLSYIQATSILPDSENVLVGEGNGTIDELNGAGIRLRSQVDIEKSASLNKQVINLFLSGDTLLACTPFGVVLISKSSFVVLDSYLHFIPGQTTQANSVAIFDGYIYVASPLGLSYAPRSGANLAAPGLWDVVDTLGFSSGVNALQVFNGMLLVGTSHGVYYSVDGAAFSSLSVASSINLTNFVEDGSALLLLSPGGLFRMNPDNSLVIVYSGNGSLQSAVPYSNGVVYAGTTRGMLAISDSVQTILPPGPATNQINHMSVDNNGNLWCATTSTSDRDNLGVAYMKFDGTEWENLSKEKNPTLPTNSYFQVSAVCNDEIVGGSWLGGMALLNEDGSVKNIFTNANSGLVGIVGGKPTDVLVGNAACDQNGNIWIVNSFAYNGNIFAVYSPNDTLKPWHTFGPAPQAKFISIGVDAYGGVWTGDQFGDAQNNWHGVFYYNANGTLDYAGDDVDYLVTVSDGLLSNQVNALVVDNEDQVWVGTSLGLNVIYDPTTPSYVSSIFSMLDQDVLGIDYDALDDKWVSTNSGVYVLSKDGNSRVAEYDLTNSPLPSNVVVAVACDRTHGKVYFATNSGVTQLDMGVVQPTTNFSTIKVYPDPIRLPAVRQVKIVGLVADSQLKIFTVSGKLVRIFQAQGGDYAYWDGSDDNGKLLPTGVYIIIAYSPDGSQSAITKVAVIRQ